MANIKRLDADLIKTTPMFNKLQKSQKKCVLAHLSGVRPSTPDEWDKFATQEIAKAATRLGQKNMPQERFAMMRSDLVEVLQDLEQSWTCQEMMEAFKHGAIRNEDGAKHLVINTFIQWIDRYRREVRMDAMHHLRQEQRKAVEVEHRAIDPQEYVDSAYQQWLKGNTHGLSRVYDKAVEIGLMNPSKDDKIRALQEVIREHHDRMKGHSKLMATITREHRQALRAIRLDKPDTIPDFIKIDAQTFLVLEYFTARKKAQQ